MWPAIAFESSDEKFTPSALPAWVLIMAIYSPETASRGAMNGSCRVANGKGRSQSAPHRLADYEAQEDDMCKRMGRLRRLPELECLFPKTVKEALSLLEKHSESARVIAGGTDLINKMKRRDVTAKYLIDLKGIAALNFIENDSQGLRIGATTTLSEILESSAVRELYPILTDAVSVMASPQIRNTASIAGNLCNAVPSADSAPPLIVLQAKLKVIGRRKKRTVLVEDFFTGLNKTVLDSGELVTEIMIPPPLFPGGGAYLKHMRRAEMDLAVVGVGVYLSLDTRKKICKDVKIALGAVAPTPMRAKNAEEALKGKPLDSDLIAAAARIASEESRPIDDIRSSAEYRKEVVNVLTMRAIQRCLGRA
jgi:carbon-monoxide dehydrogenase medium subunit